MPPPEFEDAVLEKLFPAPTLSALANGPGAELSPRITSESTAELRRLIIKSHKRFHVYFSPKGYANHLNHNHILHHLLAVYVLGAPPCVLRDKFDYHSQLLEPTYKSPGPISTSNWKKHLGNHHYYDSYIKFFTSEIHTRGLNETLTYYLFVPEGNWGKDEPRMVDRLLGKIIHALIHLGHSLEYGIEGMAVEGLAWTAIHPTEHQNLFDEQFFAAPQPMEHTHAFSIISRMLADVRLEPWKTCNRASLYKFTETIDSVGPIIRDYVFLWRLGKDTQEIEERLEELTWCVTVIFGLGGFRDGKRFTADVFTAHLVTSNHFLSFIIPLLKPTHQAELLRAYFAVVLIYYVCRGRPSFDFHNFFQLPVANSWRDILASSISKADEHHVKVERALARAAILYGHRPRGTFKHTELSGAEELDGSLFIKTGAMLSTVSQFGAAWQCK
ncbi:hypothetical protein RSOLAG1IB_08114 [Rhizoctonia solani AG-1 IB]|uniref:Oxidoreductase AflY n=1 Tax=Thanatephorus cucumeris (strain AG1-IB / isolate 7/3/14) TaxID=1108050 RepID=A0A0B7FKV7_THACB|nr:hypothetical protein RSOLAG1IB_08114 [Rhizoctonia solani AG-1 IB]